MIPTYDNGNVQLYQADARALPLADASVDCVVTSPPYWGLRDYGTEPLTWGGDAGCEHEWGALMPPKPGRGNKPGDYSTSALTNPDRQDEMARAPDSGAFCQRCGAWCGNLGLEPTPDLYVEHIVEVFREVRRVLKGDGTLWLNIGDSYAGSWGAQSRENGTDDGATLGRSPLSGRQIAAHPKSASGTGSLKNTPGLKNKDLIGIPWMVAFALRADGWWLRSDVIWSKPNPMPESVTDRPTRANEYLFLLTKSAKYHYDADAIREPNQASSLARKGQNNGHPKLDGERQRNYPGTPQTLDINQMVNPDGRNKCTVWEIVTQPYADAHFATFPEALVEPCILAGCREGGTVLDPFIGSGTTAAVAQRLGRRAVGVDLSAEYLELAARRIGKVPLPMDMASTNLMEADER